MMMYAQQIQQIIMLGMSMAPSAHMKEVTL